MWAIDDEHAPAYYFPRDCPRVLVWGTPTSTPEDVARFLGHTQAKWVAAIEGAWLERMRTAELFAYRFPAETFEPVDDAWMYISRKAVTPLGVEPVGDLLGRLRDQNIEVRITPSLWPLWNAVIGSTLHFSGIRLRNAAPPPADLKVTPL